MATIKSYTDLQQSKKLAKFLPLESADMYYPNRTDIKYQGALPIEYKHGNPLLSQEIAAWSLSALLSVLPEGTRLLKSTNISSIGDTKYHCDCPKGNIDVWFDNPVDACVDMIIRLNELNLL